jgi:hypothetical protein
MENEANSLNKVYDVQKIITRKYFKNKKFYLVKWLCYPITEATWEPKSNLKQIDLMLKKFEHEYPYSIDKEMYDIYCKETKRNKRTRKIKKNKETQKEKKYLSKSFKFECFTKTELKDAYYEKLKIHLHINNTKKEINKSENEFIIDLSSNTTTNSEENSSIFQEEKDCITEAEEKEISTGLIVPILE